MMPRLSADLVGPKSPDRCQSCGAAGDGLVRWMECDERDQPGPVVVVLCAKCSKDLVGPHPRLYCEFQANQPWPGCMPLCLDCRHRDGTRCAHPDAKVNGGSGVMLTVAKPFTAHIQRSPRRLSGWVNFWPAPASVCRQKEPIG